MGETQKRVPFVFRQRARHGVEIGAVHPRGGGVSRLRALEEHQHRRVTIYTTTTVLLLLLPACLPAPIKYISEGRRVSRHLLRICPCILTSIYVTLMFLSDGLSHAGTT